MDDAVQRVYEALRARVWDADEGDDDDDAIARLAPLERAIYVTCELEQELADGGWYLVFANEDDYLIPYAIAGYALLGLAGHVAHLREVENSGFGDEEGEDEGDRLDRLYSELPSADPARAAAIAKAGVPL